jgi:hypothetical protein
MVYVIDVESTFERERELADSFGDDVGDELHLHDCACALLVRVAERIGPITAELPASADGKVPKKGPDTPKLILAAQNLIGARALRAIRAARADLSVGYEFEAQAQGRVLFELLDQREAVAKDDTGVTAWNVLHDRRSFKSRKVSAAGQELYANLSDDSHGSVATIKRLMELEGGSIAPTRTHRTRATLLANASFALDQAALIAALAPDKVTLGAGVNEIGQGIKDRWAALTGEVLGDDPEKASA